jgi:hypothetical protein
MQPNEEVAIWKSRPVRAHDLAEAVFAALERSDAWRASSTICRPLDKPRPEKPWSSFARSMKRLKARTVTEPLDEPSAEQ